MLVYRYTTEEELKHIIKGDTRYLGDYNDEITMWSSHNTHRYKYGHRYLHFFKDRESIEYLKLVRKRQSKRKMFICSFDIPKSILKHCKGKGYYSSGTSGYDQQHVKLTEYAVDVDNFWCCWLVGVEKDNTNIINEESERQ